MAAADADGDANRNLPRTRKGAMKQHKMKDTTFKPGQSKPEKPNRGGRGKKINMMM